ncbi:MAG: SLC13 family permease [Halobacteria archaeon]|nr:SLC13 family permease [Halobacteria archaeon]
MKIGSRIRQVDIRWYSIPVGIAVGLLTFVFAPVEPDTGTLLGITLFCITLWIANPIPPSFTGLIGVGLIGVTFSTDLALVGFKSPATWLIIFGLIMGEATRSSGLARLIGAWVVKHGVPERTDPARTYMYLLFLLCLVGIGLAILVPSSLVRVLILLPVLAEIGDMFSSRDAKIGIFLGPSIATFYGSVGILTAGLPNVIITGIVESIGGPSVSWTEWAVHLFAVMGLGRVLLIASVVYYLYRPEEGTTVKIPERQKNPTKDERRMLLFLLIGTAIWATDFIHGLHPVFGALLVVVLALLPSLGTLEFEEIGQVDFSIIFFLGAVFAIGEGLSRTGFTEEIAKYLLAFVPGQAPLVVILALIFVVTVSLTFLMEGLAVASVLTPVVVSFTKNMGIPLQPAIMTEAIALGTYFFPYQSAVLVAIVGENVVDTTDLIKTASWCSIATTAVLLPLQLLIFTLMY